MSIAKFFWKVWLRLNPLAKNAETDYIADVSIVGNSLRNEDIARQIIKDGSEIKYDTLVSVLNQSDRIKRQTLQSGGSVRDGVSYMAPRVSGTWKGANARYDPAIHKVTLDMIPSAEMYEDLKAISLEVLGIKDGGAYIGMVTDTFTRLTDGSITPNEDILIEGDKLKVVPEGDDHSGVFFINGQNEAIPVTRRLTQNTPKKILARVPVLPPGEYTLQVRTRFSTSSQLLNQARVIEYLVKLRVEG